MSTRHDRREQERREQKRRPHRGPATRRNIPGWVAPVVVLAALAFGILGLRAAGVLEPPVDNKVNFDDPRFNPTGEKPGTKQKDSGSAHVADGQQVTYDVLPPVSGPHWQMPHAGWGEKNTPQEEERFVHNLEHGGMVISYNAPTPEDLSKLKTLVRQLTAVQFKKVMLHPYPKMTDAKIAVGAWNWLLKLDRYDEEALVKFIRAHYGPNGEAPEPSAQ